MVWKKTWKQNFNFFQIIHPFALFSFFINYKLRKCSVYGISLNAYAFNELLAISQLGKLLLFVSIVVKIFFISGFGTKRLDRKRE